ncbi:MAG: hypothetical protein ACP5VQ_10835, partial [Phycisphaerae bacterium]
MAHRCEKVDKLFHLAGVAAIYLFSAILFLIPIHFNLSTQIVARQIPDTSQAAWFYVWWSFAIHHGLNPLYTHKVWAPIGYNLIWTESTPAIAIPLIPVTALFGPLVAYNIMAIIAMTLDAFVAFLL